MDCRESRDLMSGAVDNQLEINETSDFFGHIEICGSCRDEYELEKLTKAYLRRKITFVDVPDDLVDTIMESISASTGEVRQNSAVKTPASAGILQPLLALGVVIVLAIALLFANMSNVISPGESNQSATVTGNIQRDILSKVENDFQEILSGNFKPQITAIAASDVAQFISQNAGYSPKLPAVPTADWIGGSVSVQGGIKTCSIVYKMGETFIYIYGFPQSLMDSKTESLPQSCLDKIKNGDRYWTMDSDGDVQVVWSHDGHICVATSNLGRTDLAGYLRVTNGTTSQ